jgi:hypothetical protein
MSRTVGVIIFEGGDKSDGWEMRMHPYRQLLTVRTCMKFLKQPLASPVIVATNYVDLMEEAHLAGIQIFDTSEWPEFHFGEVLARIIDVYDLKKVVCLSGPSVPLRNEDEVLDLLLSVSDGDQVVWSNNPQSADISGFSPASAIHRIHLPDIDNPLPGLLKDQAGLAGCLLPISVGYSFDVDTPSDLVYLTFHPDCPEPLRVMVGHEGWDRTRVSAATKVLATENSEVFFSGRVGPWIITYINERLRFRTRVISEERGMKALGREYDGQVHSILGTLIDLMGPDGFFEYLASFCDAAFIDTRVVYAHWKIRASIHDRFSSDLGLYADISDQRIRALTLAASRASIPVVLGGHSAVSGGLMVLIDAILRGNI